MKNHILILLALSLLILSCKSEREKEIEKINDESKEILSEATATLLAGNHITKNHVDTILQTWANLASDSAELGYKFALEMQKFADSPETYIEQYKSSKNNSADTTTYFDLRLVNKWNDYGWAHITLELTNRFDKHIDNFWIEAELRDKQGGYLAGKEHIHFNNVRPERKMVEEEAWENTNVNEIGSILLTPYRLEIEGDVYKFKAGYVKLHSNKHNIILSF